MGFTSDDVEEFLSRCEKGEKASVIKMIKKHGKDILKQTGAEYGQTPLHVCCENGRDELVQYLLGDRFSAQVNVHATEKNGWTPLHAACKGGHFDIIEMLLRKGAVLRAITNEGATPLHYFVRLSEGADPVKHNRIMKTIMAGSFIDAENKHGQTPLHQAAGNSRFQNIIYLIQHNADCNKQDRQGDTALHFAARVNNAESAKMLLQFHADPSIANMEGKTPYSLVRKWDCPFRRSLIAWYRENDEPMPAEMIKDLEGGGSSESKTSAIPIPSSPAPVAPTSTSPRTASPSTPPTVVVVERVRERARSSSSESARRKSSRTSTGARSKASRRSQREKEVVRVTSLRGMDSDPTTKELRPKRTMDRKRSSSVSILDPNMDNIDTSGARNSSAPGSRNENITEAGDPSAVGGVHKRIESLFQRAAERDSTKSRDSIDAGGTVGKNEITLARINRLKNTAADVVDVKAIEGEVGGSDAEESGRSTTESLQGSYERLPPALAISSFSDEKLLSHLHGGWTCRVCNTETQDAVPLLLGCASPDEYHALEDKSRENSRLSADLCTIGKNKTFVRGLLEFPLRLGEGESLPSSSPATLTWSVWVEVARTDFDRVVAGWNDETALTIEGTLANRLPLYDKIPGSSVTLATRPHRLRPLLRVTKSANEDFLRHARDGIEIQRLSEILLAMYKECSSES